VTNTLAYSMSLLHDKDLMLFYSRFGILEYLQILDLGSTDKEVMSILADHTSIYKGLLLFYFRF
jgi:hypothetical protein